MSNDSQVKHLAASAGRDLLLQELLLVLHKEGIDVEGVLNKVSPDNRNAANAAYDLFKGQLEWFEKTGQKL